MATSAWEKRNEAARAKGYRNYYDYRAHGYGRRPAERPQFTGDALARVRGHRSRSDLLRQVDEGALVTFNGAERDSKGRYKWVELAVVDEHGHERIYRLSGRQLSEANLRSLVNTMLDAGAILTPTKSLDLMQYAE